MKTAKYILVATLMLTSLAAEAKSWSLDDCIRYAIDNNLTVRAQRLSQMSAEQSVTDAKSRYLPQVSAGANQNWSIGRGLTIGRAHV